MPVLECSITSSSGNSRRLWRDLSTILGRKSEPNVTPTFSAESYLSYLREKVQEVRRSTERSVPATYTEAQSRLDFFTRVTEAEVREIFSASLSKSCALDPIPAFLLCEVADDLFPYMVSICNVSFEEATLPTSHK